MRRDPATALAELLGRDRTDLEPLGADPPAYLATTPSVAVEVLRARGNVFFKGPATLTYGFALGDGTAARALSGSYAPFRSLEEYRREKRAGLRSILTPHAVESARGDLRAASESVARTWSDSSERDLAEDAAEIALLAAVTVFFRRQMSDELADILRSLRRTSDAADAQRRDEDGSIDNVERGVAPSARPDASLAAERQVLVEAAVDALQRTPPLAGPPQGAIVALEAVEAPSGQPMTRRQLRTSIAGLIFAAHENTGVTLAWLLRLLAEHPDIQERVAAESGAGAAPPNVVLAAVQETLRLYPAVWSTARQATRPTELAGTTLKTGAVVVCSPWLHQRDPLLWPDPLRFDPGRFERTVAETSGPYFPFGLGPRSCIGQSLAHVELCEFIGALLRAWWFSVPAHAARPEARLATSQRPAGPVRLFIERRRDKPQNRT